MERDGVGVWRLSGVVDRDDAYALIRSLRQSGELGAGCFVLDFEHVVHIDYSVIELITGWFPAETNAVFSGLSDDALEIFAFVTKEGNLPIYPDWRKALRSLLAERGKLHKPAAAGSTESKQHA
jgi:hypothetical protein